MVVHLPLKQRIEVRFLVLQPAFVVKRISQLSSKQLVRVRLLARAPGACSSVVERYPDMIDVGGPIPSMRTMVIVAQW